MYRAILPNGQLECENYRQDEHGVELYSGDDELLAFVPYENLEALLTDAATQPSGLARRCLTPTTSPPGPPVGSQRR